MKTLNLAFEDTFHAAVKHSAKKYNESLRVFIENAIKARLSVEDYIKITPVVKDYLDSGKDTSKFIKVNSIKDLF